VTDARTRTIQVGVLARVEGEGGLNVHIRDGLVSEIELRIFESPRLFEALLRGRMFHEVPDITARICGICPIAYMLSASQAIEPILDISMPQSLSALRRLIYCGEWIDSHVLHAAMLHAPDFLGLNDAFELAKIHPQVVTTALDLKKLGNRIVATVGGRAIHPVNLRIGGFYRAPSLEGVRELVGPLRQGIGLATELGRFFASLPFPEYETDYTFVSLHHPEEYAIERGRIVSNRRLDIPVNEFLAHFCEEQIAYSTALHGQTSDGQPYLVGPLARFANNRGQLTPIAAGLADEWGLGAVCRNPFKSILVRMVETVLACEEALRIAETVQPPTAACVDAPVRPGIGHGATEAPRGICYHRYAIDGEGRVEEARIVPPTSQNLRQIEADLRRVIEANLDLDDRALQWRCEQTIRNYDPCISCATHFLRLTIDR
jgi:coenzyme F420-reducing hydrogenase alpha subunit